MSPEEKAIVMKMPTSFAAGQSCLCQSCMASHKDVQTITLSCSGYFTLGLVDGLEVSLEVKYEEDMAFHHNGQRGEQEWRLAARNFPYPVTPYAGDLVRVGGEIQSKQLAYVPIEVPAGKCAGKGGIVWSPTRKSFAFVSIVQGSSVHEVAEKVHVMGKRPCYGCDGAEWPGGVCAMCHLARRDVQGTAVYDAERGLGLNEAHKLAVRKQIQGQAFTRFGDQIRPAGARGQSRYEGYMYMPNVQM